MKIFNVALLAFAAAPSLVKANVPTKPSIGDCAVKDNPDLPDGIDWDIAKGANNIIKSRFNYAGVGYQWFSWKYLPCQEDGTSGSIGPHDSSRFANNDGGVHFEFYNPDDRHIDENGQMFCVRIELYLGEHDDADRPEHEVASLVAVKECKVTVFVDDNEQDVMVFSDQVDLDFGEAKQQGLEIIENVEEEKIANVIYDEDASSDLITYWNSWDVCISDSEGSGLKVTRIEIFDKDPRGSVSWTKYHDVDLDGLDCAEDFSCLGKKNVPPIPTDVCCYIPGTELGLEWYKKAEVYIKVTLDYDFSPPGAAACPTSRRLGEPTHAFDLPRLLQEDSGSGEQSLEHELNLVDPDTSGASRVGVVMAGAVAALGMIAL